MPHAANFQAPLCLPWRMPPRQGRAIVPVFLPFEGCPTRCVFCAQDVQTGARGPAASSGPGCPDAAAPAVLSVSAGPCRADLARVLATARAALEARAAQGLPPAELAFYGGTFTALPQDRRDACAALAVEALGRGWTTAFRCSTRPDSADAAVLDRLRRQGCETVELGVQSFSDAALRASARGYDGACALAACARVRAAGLRLGVQLLPGMPGHRPEDFAPDVARALDAGADMLRFYPCLVLEGTALAALWRQGRYAPWPLETALDVLARGWLAAMRAHVPVIRMGLAPEPDLARAVLAGPADPALGGRVMARALLLAVREALCAQRQKTENGSPAVPEERGGQGGGQGGSPPLLEVPAACQGFFWGARGELRPAWAALGLSPERVRFTSPHGLRLLPGLPPAAP